jgi:hypothetical protein
MRFLRGIALPILVLALASCTHGDHDELAHARRRLRPAPCDGGPAVAAVSGVNESNQYQVFVSDWVVVSVCNAGDLLKTADAAQKPITLYAEGIDTGNELMGVDAQSGAMTFIIDRNDQNREFWRPFLYDPLFDPEVEMHLSVGLKGERPIARVPNANTIVHVQKIYVDWTTSLFLVSLLIFTVVLFYAARKTDMLRIGPAFDGVRQPYSLGRSQMAWWFFLVVISYTYIWLITGDQDTIPTSVLGLMGISSATALAAVFITPSGSTTPRKSEGFWRDIVTNDLGSVALDRLQIVVWTIILGGIFLRSVIWELTMPDFSTTMLALMGISSGTYIGFQFPQAKSAGSQSAA